MPNLRSNSQNKHNFDIIRDNNYYCINKKITIYLKKDKRVIEYLCSCLQNNNKDEKSQPKNSSSKINDITYQDSKEIKTFHSEILEVPQIQQSLEDENSKNESQKKEYEITIHPKNLQVETPEEPKILEPKNEKDHLERVNFLKETNPIQKEISDLVLGNNPFGNLTDVNTLAHSGSLPGNNFQKIENIQVLSESRPISQNLELYLAKVYNKNPQKF